MGRGVEVRMKVVLLGAIGKGRRECAGLESDNKTGEECLQRGKHLQLVFVGVAEKNLLIFSLSTKVV